MCKNRQNLAQSQVFYVDAEKGYFWGPGEREAGRGHPETAPPRCSECLSVPGRVSRTHLCLILPTDSKNMNLRGTLDTLGEISIRERFTKSGLFNPFGSRVESSHTSGQPVSARLFSGVKAPAFTAGMRLGPCSEGGPLSRLPRAAGLLVLGLG